MLGTKRRVAVVVRNSAEIRSNRLEEVNNDDDALVDFGTTTLVVTAGWDATPSGSCPNLGPGRKKGD